MSGDVPTAIVTGAAGGIGAAVAARLARDGYTVAAVDRLPPADASHGLAIQADLVHDQAVAGMVSRVLETTGRIDVLVNCAGVTAGVPLHETTETGWRDVLEANLTPVYLCARHVLPTMIAARYGVIVNLGSVLAHTPASGLPAYAAAKGAIAALTRQLAVDYGRFGIRCNTISPGWIRTRATESRLEGEMDLDRLRECHPTGQLGEPDDVAAVVAFLAGPEAAFVNGAEIVLDGGASIVKTDSLLRPGPRRKAGLPPLHPE